MKAKDLAEWRQLILQRDGYICANCGVKENSTAHHIKPQNEYPELMLETDNGMTLCVQCHIHHHAIERGYWENTSAASLAREIDTWAKVIIRRADALGIAKGSFLSEQDKRKLLANPPVRRGHKLHRHFFITSKNHSRFYWPLTLKEEGYTGELKIFEGFSAIIIPKPTASSKDIAKTLELLAQDFKYRAQKEERNET